ncbi:hypothetical protein E2C01_100739 [Portunus trituberculatus]|uniref:Uncharacterized protein n=1 Tax=Portunus trituberculatus TaxID=210409 RepID=A0A5B7KIN8_PORTR|nr:hypothetical protein [Portunus trituberculatus]
MEETWSAPQAGVQDGRPLPTEAVADVLASNFAIRSLMTILKRSSWSFLAQDDERNSLPGQPLEKPVKREEGGQLEERCGLDGGRQRTDMRCTRWASH